MEEKRASLTWKDVLHDVWWYYNLCPDTPSNSHGYIGQAAGGSLHIVLDDGNIEDENVDFCIEYATKEGDLKGLELANKIRQLTWMQRARLYHKYHLYCYGAIEPNE